MKVEIKEVFNCDFCKKHLFRKSAMTSHEEHCTYNPKNFNQCGNCDFCKEDKLDVYSDYFGNTITTKVFYCTKKDIGIYPHAVIRKGLLKRFPHQFENQIPMPNKDCEDFKDIYALPF